MLMRGWFWMVGFVNLTGLVTMLLMRQLTLVGGGLALLFLMLVVICLVFVVDDITLFLIFIGSSLPCLGPLLIMMETMVLPLILWCANCAEISQDSTGAVLGDCRRRARCYATTGAWGWTVLKNCGGSAVAVSAFHGGC